MKKPSLKKTGNKNTIKHPITIPIGSSRMVYMQKKWGYIDGKCDTINMAYDWIRHGIEKTSKTRPKTS